jgi:hypothetical protein
VDLVNSALAQYLLEKDVEHAECERLELYLEPCV